MNFTKWIWPGFLTTVVGTIAAAIIAAPAVEVELTHATTNLIEKSEIDWSKVELDGRDLTLSGTAPLPHEVDTALNIAQNMYGVRIVDNRTTLLPEQKPYKYVIIRDANNVSMEGYSPNNKSHSKMLQNFDNGEFTLVNNTSLARGALDNHDEIARFMANQMKFLKSGKASLENDKLTISGMAQSKSSYNALQNELTNNLPSGISLASNDVEIPTYKWLLEKNNNSVFLSGSVPDKLMKEKITEWINEKYGDRFIIDNQLTAENGAPAEFETAVIVSIQALSRLKNAKFSLEDENYTVSGETLTPIGSQQTKARISASLPTQFKGSVDLDIYEIKPEELVTAQTCQSMLNNMMVGNSIEFDSGKAAINSKSFPLLDQLVYTTRLCPKSRVEIEGHSDSDGNDDANQVLSENRANSVRKYLATNGVKSDRLDAVGYGEVKPIADNSTAEGKAKNRRIEFRILQN